MQVAINSRSVLIAEDAAPIRKVLRHELDKHYKVVAAVGDGRAAVETEERDPPMSRY
jgi:CheY-like chemotaxis protein